MYMSYTTNPHLPKLRMEAVRLVREGVSTRQVGRHLGYDHSTIVKWIKRVPQSPHARVIPTISSRPHHHPHELSSPLVETIIQYRIKHQRCAEVLHHLLVRDGHQVSCSSVKRVLKRYGLVSRSPWKKWHRYPVRPNPSKPGVLVEIDTIHDGPPDDDRLYIYTLLDVCSRWAHAVVSRKITTHQSVAFVRRAQHVAPFQFTCLQSDHGQEFSRHFSRMAHVSGIAHRHSRVRMPSDNGHLERFNRTIQEECLSRVPRSYSRWQKALLEYLAWYNSKRPHMGINMQTPLEVVTSY